MGEMTREEFLQRAIIGAAAIALIPEDNLTPTLTRHEGHDFAVIFQMRGGKRFGLGYEFTGEEDKDIQGLKWLHRAAELQYKGEEF